MLGILLTSVCKATNVLEGSHHEDIHNIDDSAFARKTHAHTQKKQSLTTDNLALIPWNGTASIFLDGYLEAREFLQPKHDRMT